ncbi:hypothetical protein NP233_g6311 [Leucocoprinus birnbaumii]|uniref:F-box domain-containing protein n=1 Tax=Leucocoprinus birnbaumii TaxID=56174 RepID=A0AAD5YR18_9AGAR|nr:hypothetical protein NP233_g6311 [Leucocoprinus birnbaumii]
MCPVLTSQPKLLTPHLLVYSLPRSSLKYSHAYIHTPSPTSLWDESHLLASADGSSPFILGQICAYWRSVALNTPTLWSSLYIENPTPYMVPHVQMWLERANSIGLTLVVRDWLDSEVRECDEGTRGVLCVLMEKGLQWRSVDFVLELRDNTVFDDIADCPELEDVRLVARYWDQRALDAFWSNIHGASPSMKKVNWWKAFNSQDVGLPGHAPWRQLQSITTSRLVTDEELLFILYACPDLEYLSVRYSSSPSTLPPPTTPSIRHDHLETLILHLASNAAPIFEFISLPSLKALHLANGFDYGLPALGSVSSLVEERIGRPIQECLKRSSPCQLRELAIHRFDHGTAVDSLFGMIQRLLDLSTTQNLEVFDLYPLPTDSYLESSSREMVDSFIKHPAQCVREMATRIQAEEEDQNLLGGVMVKRRPTDVVVVDPAMDAVECIDGDADGSFPEIDWKYGSDFEMAIGYGFVAGQFDVNGMTGAQADLAKLHFDD